jgi:hypothetical protein
MMNTVFTGSSVRRTSAGNAKAQTRTVMAKAVVVGKRIAICSPFLYVEEIEG